MLTREMAATIIEQLGGKKFIAMTGSREFVYDKNSLSFKIGSNAKKINYVSVIYDYGKDTYEMKFEKIIMNKQTFETKRKLISSYEDVYWDNMQDIFTEATGLYTSL